jgi:putative transposase
LVELKREKEWLAEVSAVCVQQSIRHLESAFVNFFQGRARYPTFKSKQRIQAASYMRNAFAFRNGEITLAKQKQPLDIRWSRRFSGEPTSLTVSRDPSGRYFISILVEERVDPLPPCPKAVGLDLGLTHQIVDSAGHRLARPGFLEIGLRRLRRLQRRLSRKQRGSNNRGKQKRQVARQHAKIRDRRMDFLHKVSRQLVDENQVIAVEDLSVKEMIQNKRLSRHIADAAWSTLLRLLAYKCQWYGRDLVAIDRYFPSSKQCSSCGFCTEEMPLQQRRWTCPDCNSIHDRDGNAAQNILRKGLRRLAEKSGVPWGTRDFKPVECV